MKLSPFDNLPTLSQQEALAILSTPLSDLRLSSDYYKAVYHLAKYPGEKTESALLNLLRSESSDMAISIAKRKGVEVLAKLGCVNAIPLIGNCLQSSDPYLVENSALALLDLKCTDENLLNCLFSLLGDSKQNRRVIIQVISELSEQANCSQDKLISAIKPFCDEKNLKPDVRGAALAALYKFNRRTDFLDELEIYLFLSNQNN